MENRLIVIAYDSKKDDAGVGGRYLAYFDVESKAVNRRMVIPDAGRARALAADLLKLADELDPPQPKVTGAINPPEGLPHDIAWAWVNMPYFEYGGRTWHIDDFALMRFLPQTYAQLNDAGKSILTITIMIDQGYAHVTREAGGEEMFILTLEGKAFMQAWNAKLQRAYVAALLEQEKQS